jgi:hypothetical protein
MATPGPPAIPSDQEMRERAAHAIRQTALFAHVSGRLIVDLVERIGLRSVEHALPAVVKNVHPAMLIVLEGEVVVHATAATLALAPGTYLAFDPVLAAVDWASGSVIESARADPVRIFLVTCGEFHALPRVMVNALDPAALDKMNTVCP